MIQIGVELCGRAGEGIAHTHTEKKKRVTYENKSMLVVDVRVSKYVHNVYTPPFLNLSIMSLALTHTYASSHTHTFTSMHAALFLQCLSRHDKTLAH